MIAIHNNRLSTRKQREAFFIALYKKAFPMVAAHVARMGGSLVEAQDIFQDALVIYYEKAAAAKTEKIINEQAYLLGIAKKLWLQHYKNNSNLQSLQGVDVEAVADEKLATDKLFHYLETTGKKCMELLRAYYYDCFSVNNVVALFGYSGTHSATVAKYKCLEKVRETVKQKTLTYADFVE